MKYDIVDGHLAFHLGAITFSAAMNILVHGFWLLFLGGFFGEFSTYLC